MLLVAAVEVLIHREAQGLQAQAEPQEVSEVLVVVLVEQALRTLAQPEEQPSLDKATLAGPTLETTQAAAVVLAQ